jgi:hypothetical protein
MGPIGMLATCTTETKGAMCTNEGVGCKKSCGPQSVGWKSETCTNALVVEGKTCEFECGDTSVNWGCYSLTAATSCDTTNVPVSGAACTAAACVPCAGGYKDTSNTAKTGACVCVAGATMSKWSCAATTPTNAWPTCVP